MLDSEFRLSDVRHSSDAYMSRNVTIVALIQLLVVILGFFALGMVLKVEGYPDDPPLPASLGRAVWSPLVLLLREHGLALLSVPVGWTILTSRSQNRRIIFSQDIWLIIGVIAAVAIIALFIYACTNRYAYVPN